MAKRVLIKPLISEKSEKLGENLNQYSFIVDKQANKIEIRKAIEDFYNVKVAGVNTIIMPAKSKGRTTRSGISYGQVGSYKKAIVRLAEGEFIDFYGDV